MPIIPATGRDAKATCLRHNQFANASTGDVEEGRRSRTSRKTDVARFEGTSGIGRAASSLRVCSNSFGFISVNINGGWNGFPQSFIEILPDVGSA